MVESRTGIPASKIGEIAREMVAARPTVVVVDEGMCDCATVAAAIAVNALLSSLDAPGGMLLDQGITLADFGEVARDDTARAGLRAPAIDGRDPAQRDFGTSRILALPQAFLSGKPYAAKALLLSYSNPAYSKPDGKRWMEAMDKVPFIASFSPILDESVLVADLVLPDCTFFERWDIVAPGRASHVLSLRQPVVRPLVDSQQTATGKPCWRGSPEWRVGPMPCWANSKARACGARLLAQTGWRVRMAIAQRPAKQGHGRFYAT